TRSYDDRDGVKKYITEVVADNMQMLSRKQQGSDDYGSNSGSGYGQGSTSQQEQQSNATSENAGGQANAGAESPPDNASHQSQQGPDNDLSPSGDEADDLPF
ncbi:MAG TPA: hypothetical protein VJ951_08270, partial [Bacteroidales bacterium]|nr:hypothetical protein [Bacteroidales bacterium]